MSTTLATQPTQPTLSRVNQQEIQQMIALDEMLSEFRTELARRDVGDMARMLIQARAMTALEEAISPAMMKDIMKLMNSPLGFKTDRPPGKSELYGVETVKRCLIVAWLSGAKATGNEFNIIAGNCYLTKEFTRPAILRFPGVSHFEEQLGAPMRHGDKTAICEAIATWFVNGEQHEIRCVKTEVMDARIVVNAYATSSPDELRGKVQAKLYQRVLSRLTGLNLTPDLSGDSADTIEVVPRSSSKAAIESSEKSPEISDSQTAKTIHEDSVAWFAKQESINDIKKYCHDRFTLIDSAEWSNDLKFSTKDLISQAADERIQEIRTTRAK